MKLALRFMAGMLLLPFLFQLSEGGVPYQVSSSTQALSWNTFLGGTSYDGGSAIAVDSNGNLYVTGSSWASWGSPIRSFSANDDAFVAKLSGSGVLQWVTFLGGTGNDYGYGIGLDGVGNIYVSGYSSASWGSPVRSYSGSDDAFVAKLNSSGSLEWNTFLGASGYDYGLGLAVDPNSGIYVAGYSTVSWGSPIRAFTASSNDGYVAKLDSNGSLLWNTFLGGSNGDGCYGVAVDSSGNVCAAGWSNSSWGSPVRAYTGGEDVLVAKLDGNGALQWNTFLGGTSNEEGWGVNTDASGNVYVTGKSDDAFVAKLNTSGALQWDTALGGAGSDIGQGVAADGNGNVYVVGYSSATWGSPASAFVPASYDPYVALLDANGTLQWNTFLGGSDYNSKSGIAVDTSGDVFVIGESNSWGSPIRPYSGGTDAFAAKFQVAAGFTLSSSPSSATVTAGQSAAYAIQVIPQSGSFNSPVSFTCTGLPKACTASFSPASVTPGADVAATALTLTTKADSSSSTGMIDSSAGYIPPSLGLILASLFLLMWFGSRKPAFRRFSNRRLTVGTLILAITLAVSCGGGGGDNTPTNNGTPKGTYQISVQGTSGSVTASTNVTLIVN